MKLENIWRKDVRLAIQGTLDFRCIPQFHPKKNTGVSLLPTIIVEEVLEFHISSEYRYPEGSNSVAFPKGYQYLSYMNSQLSKNTTARCQEDCPNFKPEHIFVQEEPGKQLGNAASF